jgi:hypothetical protein
MNNAYQKVKQFHQACGISMPSKPTMLSNGNHNLTVHDFANRLDMLVKQMKQASTAGFGGEVLERASYVLEEMTEFLMADNLTDQVDALTDALYFLLGSFTKVGVQPEQIFNIVAQANAGKVREDGTVLRDEMGKIKKPEGWHEKYAPEGLIKLEIERQSRTAECKTCNGTSLPVYGLACPECC